MEVLKWILKPGAYKGSVYSYLDQSGTDPYRGLTELEWIAAGYRVVTDEELQEIVGEFIAGTCGQWTEITEDRYYEMLCVLPPIKYYGGGFYCSEAVNLDIYNFYQELDGKYYCSLQQISRDRNEILDELRGFVYKETD